MAHWFDHFSEALAVRHSRRQALTLFATGVGLAVLGRTRALEALAAESPASQAGAITYPPGWNLVGGSPGSTLSGATDVLYTLQPGDSTYQTVPASSPLTPCWGYWAYFPNGGGINFGVNGASYVCNLNVGPAGWVMVGNPSAVSAANVSGAQETLTYTPAAGYQNVTAIPAGAGAWVYASGAVSIAGPQPAPAPAPAPVQAPPPAQSAPPPQTSPPPSTCCRTCTTGCPCGNSCITCRDTCHTAGGCAC